MTLYCKASPHLRQTCVALQQKRLTIRCKKCRVFYAVNVSNSIPTKPCPDCGGELRMEEENLTSKEGNEQHQR